MIEVFECLVHLDVSSENDLSDDEDFISREGLVILPPNDKDDRDTNENLWDESELLASNVNRSQL